jgi:hypothetical protein
MLVSYSYQVPRSYLLTIYYPIQTRTPHIMGDYRQMLTSFIRSEYMLHLIIYLCWILSPIKFKKNWRLLFM